MLRRYAVNLRPGDVLADDDELHNGDPRVTHVTLDFRLEEPSTVTVSFADGSSSETTEVLRIVRLQRRG